MDNHLCSEISYETNEGNVHSDLCGNGDEEHRELLHKALDEWLNKANGTGSFTVGNYKD